MHLSILVCIFLISLFAILVKSLKMQNKKYLPTNQNSEQLDLTLSGKYVL